MPDLERCLVLWVELGILLWDTGGLTGVQSSFRILPHPLQQHGQLSLGYKRLKFQSGKTMVVSPVA